MTNRDDSADFRETDFVQSISLKVKTDENSDSSLADDFRKKYAKLIICIASENE